MKLRILSLITLLALLFTMAVACTQDPANNDGESTESGTESTAPDSTPADPINIYTLNGTTGFGMAKLMNDAKGKGNGKISESDGHTVPHTAQKTFGVFVFHKIIPLIYNTLLL